MKRSLTMCDQRPRVAKETRRRWTPRTNLSFQRDVKENIVLKDLCHIQYFKIHFKPQRLTSVDAETRAQALTPSPGEEATFASIPKYKHVDSSSIKTFTFCFSETFLPVEKPSQLSSESSLTPQVCFYSTPICVQMISLGGAQVSECPPTTSTSTVECSSGTGFFVSAVSAGPFFSFLTHQSIMV